MAAASFVILGGVVAYFNTNVLNSSRMCHGLIAPDEAARALGGGVGRISAEEDTGPTGITCSVRQESWLPGHDKQLNVRAVVQETGYPFRMGDWGITSTRSVLAGGTHGAYDAYGGFALLPPTCRTEIDTDDGAPVLRAAVIGRDAAAGDAEGMADLLTSAAKAFADGPADCAAPGYADAPTRSLTPAPARTTDPEKVCGIPDFRLEGVSGPKREGVREVVTGSAAKGDGMYCALSFDGDKEPFAHVAVVNDSAFVASLTADRDFAHARCRGKETVFAHEMRSFDEGERVATGLPDAAGFSKAFTGAAQAAAACEQFEG